jgi:hypothetical protein
MTYLLVVYFFCAGTAGVCEKGEVITEKYASAATSIDDCITLGREKQKALWEEFKRDGDTAMMCILENRP